MLNDGQRSAQERRRRTLSGYRAIIVVRAMPGSRSAQFRQAGKFAWRDLRARPVRSILLVIALALSISGIAGVRAATDAALGALHQGSRASLAADVAIDTGEAMSDEQIAALDGMHADGIDWTLVTTTLTMSSSDQSPNPAFATVKAIDPAVYPFYGGSKMTLALRGDRVVVSENTLGRLHVRIGDSIRVAGTTFKISGTQKAEPEQILGILSRGLRLTLSHESYRRSGIARGGNSSRNRVLLRLNTGLDIDSAKLKLQSIFPEGNLLDYRDVNQNIGLQIESLSAFFSETALLALALG